MSNFHKNSKRPIFWPIKSEDQSFLFSHSNKQSQCLNEKILPKKEYTCQNKFFDLMSSDAVIKKPLNGIFCHFQILGSLESYFKQFSKFQSFIVGSFISAFVTGSKIFVQILINKFKSFLKLYYSLYLLSRFRKTKLY